MITQFRSQTVKWQFCFVFIVKLLCLAFFTSAYQTQLFLPFVSHFMQHGGDPWLYFYQHPQFKVEFPYHPLMLYLLSMFYAVGAITGPFQALLTPLLIKLPILIADIVITFCLLKLFPERPRDILIYYALSPILLYASFLHCQLDLIPMAFLFLSVIYLTRLRWINSALFFGLSMAIKSQVLAALPLMLIFLDKNEKRKSIITYLALAGSVYFIFALPFLGSEGFYHLVLANPKQMGIFESFMSMGEMQIYWVVFALFLIYGRFACYVKINTDLLDSFLILAFSTFVLLVVPSPGWYLWILPFLSLFYIKYSRKIKALKFSYYGLNLIYLGYFLGFHRFDHTPLFLMGQPLHFSLPDARYRNIAFSLLEAALFSTMLICYRTGVKSNAIYGRTSSLIIGIGGDSAAGKTTLVKSLKMLLRNEMLEIETDGDHKWERGDENWERLTHLNPKANFLHRQTEVLHSLKRGKPADIVEYDHTLGVFKAPVRTEPREFLIVSGLHLFYLPKMRKLIDIKIFLDPPPELKTFWKIKRDCEERGYPRDEVLRQLSRRKTDVDKYIQPQRDFADLIVQFIPPPDFRFDAEFEPPELLTRVILDSSTHLENLVEALSARGYQLEWDYAEDLKTQYILLHTPLDKNKIPALMYEILPNAEELISLDCQWEDGYLGFLQLLILMLISERMKEKENASYV